MVLVVLFPSSLTLNTLMSILKEMGWKKCKEVLLSEFSNALKLEINVLKKIAAAINDPNARAEFEIFQYMKYI